MDIRSDRQKGLSYAEISRKYHIDPRTAKKYAHSETRPVYKLTGPKSSKLDPYKERILHWLEEAPKVPKQHQAITLLICCWRMSVSRT